MGNTSFVMPCRDIQMQGKNVAFAKPAESADNKSATKSLNTSNNGHQMAGGKLTYRKKTAVFVVKIAGFFIKSALLERPWSGPGVEPNLFPRTLSNYICHRPSLI